MKSKANRQIKREIQTVFKRYGVEEYRVVYASDDYTIHNFFKGSTSFAMQTALSALGKAIKISMGE
jgi:hypothetical protein